MSLGTFAITTSPAGTDVTVHGQPFDATRAVLEMTAGDAPVLTIWQPHAAGTVTGEGVIQVVRDPTPAEVDAAAAQALRRVDVTEVARRVRERIRHTPGADPFAATVEVLAEMADG